MRGGTLQLGNVPGISGGRCPRTLARCAAPKGAPKRRFLAETTLPGEIEQVALNHGPHFLCSDAPRGPVIVPVGWCPWASRELIASQPAGAAVPVPPQDRL